MARPLRIGLAIAATLGLALPARALDRPSTPALDAERDALIEKITKGIDYDASVRRFGELLRERDRTVATSAAAQQAESAQREATLAWRDAYRKSADHEVGWRCTLTPDPAHPLPSTESRFKPDWGKIVRKERVQLPGKNALDPGETVTLYELAGVAGRQVFRGERFDPHRGDFSAEVGELALVCRGSEKEDQSLPAGWAGRVVSSGFAVRIARPPKIVDKARWQPIHITGSAFYWAIREARWKWTGQHVLSNVEIGRDLGGGRFDVPTNNGLSWVLEVPPALARKALVVPGHSVWLVLGEARLDPTLRKLVLVAEDVEERYVTEPPPR